MNEKVQAFLDKRKADLSLQDQQYYYYVMKKAGLLSDQEDFIEVTEEEYKQSYADIEHSSKQEDGKYYLKMPLPLDITDEEFAAVEAALPKETLAGIRLRSQGVDANKDESSAAATFFTVIAWLLFIGGLILAIAISISTEEYGYYSSRTNFNFTTFISTFITYFIYGCFALCAAELFKKLQTIVNLLRRKE